MPRISEALDLDEKKEGKKWLEIAENLAPYPKGTIREIQENPTLWKEVDVKLEDLLPEEMLDKEIYYDEGIGGKWSFHFPGNVMQIYPAMQLGLEVPGKSWKWREIQCRFMRWWKCAGRAGI